MFSAARSWQNGRKLAAQYKLMQNATRNMGGVTPLMVKVQIGTREIVGHGINGEENYMDSDLFPYPAIRFKEETAEMTVIKNISQILTCKI